MSSDPRISYSHEQLEKAAKAMMVARGVDFPFDDPEEEAAAIANAISDLEAALGELEQE